MSRFLGRAGAPALLALVLIVCCGNLWASWMEVHSYQAQQNRLQAAQQRAGRVIEARLCTTLARLAANLPPAGDPSANPSRAYDQTQHEILAQLGPDVGCPR